MERLFLPIDENKNTGEYSYSITVLYYFMRIFYLFIYYVGKKKMFIY